MFEKYFLTQGENENRSIEETLDIGWAVLSVLPKPELYRIKQELIEKYMEKAETNVCEALQKELALS